MYNLLLTIVLLFSVQFAHAGSQTVLLREIKSQDGKDIDVTLGPDSGDDFNINDTVLVEGDKLDRLTIGIGTAGVDFLVYFDGEDSDASIKHDEDNSVFDFSQGGSFSDFNITDVDNIALDSISSDSDSTIIVNLDTDAGDDLKINNGADFITIEGDTGKLTGNVDQSATGDFLWLSDDGTNLINVDVSPSSGEGTVQIGTTTDDARLSIASTTDGNRFNTVFLSNGIIPVVPRAISGNQHLAVSVQGDGAAYWHAIDVTNDIEFIFGSSAIVPAQVFMGSLSAHDLSLRVANNSLVYLRNSDKRVGVGSTGPQAKLHVLNDVSTTVVVNSKGTVGQTSHLYQAQDSSNNIQFYIKANGGMIVNEEGNNDDSRIEGDGDTSLTYWDAGNDTVTIGGNLATGKFNINGTGFINDKLIFTQTDGNENIDSLADGYLDYIATTGHRFNTTVATNGGRLQNSTRITSGPYTVLATDHIVIANTDGGDIEIDLPAGVADTTYTIKSTGNSGNTLTIDPNGSEQLFLGGAGVAFDMFDLETIIINYNATDGWV
jgi:hypothetical protein